MSELRVLACAVLLAAGVAAAVAAVAVRYGMDAPPGIASVRLAELAAHYATGAAETDAPGDEVRAWGMALEEALAEVAARHRVVLLPARAIAAGAPDLTREVEAALAAALPTRASEPARESGR